jgi:uncharacterized membrane protein
MNKPVEVPPMEYDPLLNSVIERNIRTMTRDRLQVLQDRSREDRAADRITDFSGRMPFVYFHIVWFGAWIIINSGLVGIEPFDPFPFSFLTMVVSLEAIFLATFVLISQNRFSVEADRRAELALHVSLLSEHEITRLLQMVDAVQQKLGIEYGKDYELAQLEKVTKPEDMLAAIRRMAEQVENQN